MICTTQNSTSAPLLDSPDSRIGITHMEKERGAEVWCLFMYDIILSLNKRALNNVENTILFGGHVHTHAYLDVDILSKEMIQSEYGIITFWCLLL